MKKPAPRPRAPQAPAVEELPKTMDEAVGLAPVAPDPEPEKEAKEPKVHDTSKDVPRFEELFPATPSPLHAEPLRWAASRIGSRGCDLWVSPGLEAEAQRLAAKTEGVEHVIVEPRLPHGTWFVKKGGNAIGSAG